MDISRNGSSFDVGLLLASFALVASRWSMESEESKFSKGSKLACDSLWRRPPFCFYAPHKWIA